MRRFLFVFILAINYQQKVCSGDSISLRGPALVERNPILLNSFLPAAMQIIAHCTELLKYDVKPAGPNPTSTTVRPTPPHSPGIYAPRSPTPLATLRKGIYSDYIQKLKHTYNVGYFNKYKIPLEATAGAPFPLNQDDVGISDWAYFKTHDIAKALEMLGQRPTNILKKITRDEEYDFLDDDLNVRKFADDYDDASFRNYVIGNKVVPPTRAYVTLLTLYDALNKESKKLQLNKYGGYAEDILKALAETSTRSSANQLHVVLYKIMERQDTTDQNIIGKIKVLLEDLEQQNSYLNEALRYIPPLVFSD